MDLNSRFRNVSTVVVKVAALTRRVEFRHRLERLAFAMLEEAAGRNFEALTATSAVLEELVTLGRAIYEIEPMNAEFLTQELRSLTAFVRESYGVVSPQDVADAWGKPTGKLLADGLQNSEYVAVPRGKMPEYKREIESAMLSGNESGKASGKISGNADSDPAIRQLKIAETLKAIDRPVQMREIMSAFQGLSERTIRYDLQKLCQQGIVGKAGSGPSTYYKHQGTESRSPVPSAL